MSDPSNMGEVEYNPAGNGDESEAESARLAAEDQLMRLPGVVGVGLGQDDIGGPAILVYVTPEVGASSIPARIQNFPVQVVESGEIDIQGA